MNIENIKKAFEASGKTIAVVVAKYDGGFLTTFEDMDLSPWFSILMFNSFYEENLREHERKHFDMVLMTTTDTLNTYDSSCQQDLGQFEAKELESLVRGLTSFIPPERVYLIAMEEEMLRSVARIRQMFNLPGVKSDEVQRFCNKPKMLQWATKNLQSSILQIPKYQIIDVNEVKDNDKVQQLAKSLEKVLGLPIILKHSDGAGALGTKRITQAKDILPSLKDFTNKPFMKEFVAQQYINPDSEIEAYNLVKEGQIVFQEFGRLINSLFKVVVENQTLGAITVHPVLEKEDYNAMSQIAQDLLKAMSPVPNGIFFFQVLKSKDDGRWYFVENTIRVPGDVVPRVVQQTKGINLEAAQIILPLPGNQFSTIPKRNKISAGLMYRKRRGKLVGFRPFPPSVQSTVTVDWYCKPGDEIGDSRSLDDGIASISIEHEDFSMLKRDLGTLMEFDPLIFEN